MIFGELPLEDAEGAILAHSLKLRGGGLRKGRVLDGDDLARLRAAGHRRVMAARLEAGDVPEDEAAHALALAVAGAGVRVAAAFTGRCNLFANRRGLLDLDAACIRAINRTHESLTVATLPGRVTVQARQMLATVKVIPFAAPRSALDAALDAARSAGGPVRVQAFRHLRAALLQTRLPGTRDSVLDKTEQVLQARLAALGSSLEMERRCDHGIEAVATELGALVAAGMELVLVAGASAIVDRRDVVPAAITAAGGELVHFGMPVDPGNLLLLGRHGAVPVLGLPGCARSPKLNGLDWVLERLATGQEIEAGDIMDMGVGGLLKEIPERPQPRGTAALARTRAPRVAAVVLAAGQSRRMGPANKLLLDVDGAPMIGRVVEQIAASAVDEIVVVTGFEAERVRDALRGQAVRLVHNARYADGLSASLAVGIGALDDTVDAALVCLGDMPRIGARQLDRLIAAYDPVEGRTICVPTFCGKRGNPVLWDRRYFAEMGQVRGDVGARHLIGEHEEAVCEVSVDAPGVLLDVDSPAALAALNEP